MLEKPGPPAVAPPPPASDAFNESSVLQCGAFGHSAEGGTFSADSEQGGNATFLLSQINFNSCSLSGDGVGLYTGVGTAPWLCEWTRFVGCTGQSVIADRRDGSPVPLIGHCIFVSNNAASSGAAVLRCLGPSAAVPSVQDRYPIPESPGSVGFRVEHSLFFDNWQANFIVETGTIVFLECQFSSAYSSSAGVTFQPTNYFLTGSSTFEIPLFNTHACLFGAIWDGHGQPYANGNAVGCLSGDTRLLWIILVPKKCAHNNWTLC
jgi:hypothetical protein